MYTAPLAYFVSYCVQQTFTLNILCKQRSHNMAGLSMESAILVHFKLFPLFVGFLPNYKCLLHDIHLGNGLLQILNEQTCSPMVSQSSKTHSFLVQNSQCSIASKQQPAAPIDLAITTMNTYILQDSGHLFYMVSKEFGGLCTSSFHSNLSCNHPQL